MAWSRFLRFSDPFLCQQAIQAADVEILPLQKGTFHSSIAQIGIDKVWMQRFEVDLPHIATIAVNPRRRVFSFLTDASSRLQYCGRQASSGDIVVVGSDVVHHKSEPAFSYGSISLPADEFPSLCRTIIGREFLEDPQVSFIRPTPALMSRLLKSHHAVARLAHDVPEIFQLPEVRRSLEERLIHLMIRCLAEGAGIETPTGGRRHCAIIARFEEFLRMNPDQPLYLIDICAAIGVAERTLRAACEEHFGMGPIRFLTLRRTHLVHRALLSADPRETSVTRIVTDHGFWELGRFAVAYRTLFGESPSETLRRPASRPAQSWSASSVATTGL